jgi:hypothetical protein
MVMPPVEVPPSRIQRATGTLRSIVRTALHDLAAHLLKNAMVWGIGLLVLGGGTWRYKDEILRLVLGPHAPLETGSIKKAPAAPVVSEEAKKRENECNMEKAREVEALVARRKSSFSAYTKCLSEWRPAWNETRTADQACAPKYAYHQQIGQQVKEKEAKDCSAHLGASAGLWGQ